METTTDRKIDPIEAAQEYLGGVSRTTIYALIEAGEIQRVNIGRRAFVTRESMDRYVERLASGAA